MPIPFGNRLIFGGPSVGALTVNLTTSEAPGAHEVFEGASTINWGGNAIDNVDNSRSTGDTINGNDDANYIRSEDGVDAVFALGGDVYYVVADDNSSADNPKGGDTVRCGEGNDEVYYDDGDAVTSLQSSCETKIIPYEKASRAKPRKDPYSVIQPRTSHNGNSRKFNFDGQGGSLSGP